MPKLSDEDKIYRAQIRWIEKKFGKKSALEANYGWGVSTCEDGSPDVATKVYGHGVLVTHIVGGKIEHDFRSY